MKKQGGFIVLVLGLWCTHLHADALRCGTQIVDVGSHKTDVLSRCGRPLSVDVRNQCESELLQTGATVQTCEKIEEWVYKKGQGQFSTLLEIRANRVTGISQAGR
jgi:Protein of unknown function (DUF2845)